MAEYGLIIKPSARKELEALNDTLFTRIERKIMTLAGNPRPPRCTKLKGHDDIWRIRIGDYRVLYTIDDQNMIVRVSQSHIAGRSTKGDCLEGSGRCHEKGERDHPVLIVKLDQQQARKPVAIQALVEKTSV